MKAEKLVVGLAGMPGAGKSLVVDAAKERGFEIVVMGDVIREEAERQHLEPTSENIGRIMLELRQNEGKGVVAKRIIPKIDRSQKQKVMVDGIRSLSEVEEFKRRFRRFSLLAVHASPQTRLERLCRRQRSDDSKNWQVFRERDMRELSVGLGEAVAMAEHIIVNEGEASNAKEEVRAILRRIEEKWTT